MVARRASARLYPPNEERQPMLSRTSRPSVPAGHSRGRLPALACATAVGALVFAAPATASAPRTFSTVGIRGPGGEPAVAFDPVNPSHLLFMTKSGISVSLDHGQHWRTVAPGIADPQLVYTKG